MTVKIESQTGREINGLRWYHQLVQKLHLVNDSKTLKAALDWTLAGLLPVLGAQGGAIRIWRGGKKSSVRADSGHGSFELCFEKLAAPDCACSRALSGGGPAAFELPPKSPCASLGAGKALCRAITAQGAAAGIFVAAFGENSEGPSPQAVELTAMALSSLGLAVENVISKKRDENMARDMETVNYIGGLIAGKLTLKEMVSEIVSRLGQVLETDEVNVIVYNEARKELSFLASHFSEGSSLQRPEVYPLSDGMNSWIIKNRKPLLMSYDTVEECKQLGIRHGGRPAKSWLGAPMIYQGRVNGVVSVQSYRKKGLYDLSSAALLRAVANMCAVAVVNAHMFEEITEREAEKERLYFSLTHDLLSLINPISGFAKILKGSLREDPEGSSKFAAESILLAADKITRFAEDILVYAKLKSGKLELDISRRRAAEPLEQAVRIYTPELLARSINLTVNGQPAALDPRRPFSAASEEVMADLDPAQMERVFLNLISNAIKHARSAIGVSITEEGNSVRALVKDDGDGVPSGVCDKLFEEYYQAHKGKRGVGLGLPSVKKIVEMHQGGIWIESGEGRGFAVHFQWPRTLADRKGAGQAPAGTL